MIGITQPRRVATLSMTQRVASELSLPPSKISHQIRYDVTTGPNTSAKFMTDGVLLREMASDFLLSKYSVIIIDEAQNLTAKQMKTLITRCGPGSKMVCLGNLGQIDTPYLSETTSGLTFVVDRFQGWPHGGHITLARGERSRLAAFASEVL